MDAAPIQNPSLLDFRRGRDYVRAADDWYVEDEQCVRDFLAAEKPFTRLVWDPCCGGGNIPRTAATCGLEMVGSDLIDRGYGKQLDFMAVSTDSKVSSIICNPPYGIAEEWIDKALSLTSDRVAVLLRLAFLEGQGRKHKFQGAWPLARVYVSSRRISMPPGAMNIKAKGGMVAYAWFVFEHGYTGSPVLGWI